MNSEIAKAPRRLKGVVMSDKMQKTAVVRVDRLRRHPKYLKYVKVSTRFKVHDEKNEAKIGDQVVIREARPLSKDKRWIVERVLVRARSVESVSSEE